MLLPLQVDKLQQLLNDDFLLNIIKEVFDETLKNNMPQIDLLENNALLGEKYRAHAQAKGIIQAGFSDLLSYKKEKAEILKSLNKAR